jgi:hypothetical protein
MRSALSFTLWRTRFAARVVAHLGGAEGLDDKADACAHTRRVGDVCQYVFLVLCVRARFVCERAGDRERARNM